MSEAGRTPLVNLDFRVHWCTRHLAPFAPQWPRGAAQAMTTLLHEALVLPAVADACGRNEAGEALVTGLDAALRRFAPLCCLVDTAARDRVYEAGGIPPLLRPGNHRRPGRER